MAIVETLFQGATVFVALAGAYLVAFWFVLIVWTFRDIESRSRSVVTQVFSTLMVVLFFVPGVLLYLILRPKETLDQAFQRSLEEEYLLQDLEELPLCPACHRYVEDDFVLCPQCHAQLREPCAACARLVDLRWALCPYCATVQDGHVEPAERIEAPAARWTAPNLRRRRVTERASVDQPAAAPAAVAEPAATSVARLDGDADPTALEPVAQPQSLPFTILSGMRSVVRQPQSSRSLESSRNGSGDNRSAPDAPSTNGSSGNGRNAGRPTATEFSAANGHGTNGHTVHHVERAETGSSDEENGDRLDVPTSVGSSRSNR